MSAAKLKVISLGWGIQSWTMAAMVALGELEPVDFVIHSDTTWEMERTYQFSKEWTPWLENKGVKVVTVSSESTRGMVSDEWAGTFIPAFTLGMKNAYIYYDQKTGKEFTWSELRELENRGIDISNFEKKFTGRSPVKGQLRRQCTGRWKIQPMRRYISSTLKKMNLKKHEGIVEQWLGITVDEWHRAKDSDVKYIKHKFPLIDKKMSRNDCIEWLKKNSLPNPGKSSCTFCPYHSKLFWEKMKRENKDDWKQAVFVDQRIRNERPPYPLYVHAARVPLPKAVIIPEDFGATQGEMFDVEDIECGSGYCFM